jgi:hypothetical protein
MAPTPTTNSGELAVRARLEHAYQNQYGRRPAPRPFEFNRTNNMPQANNVYQITTNRELVRFLHAACGSPVVLVGAISGASPPAYYYFFDTVVLAQRTIPRHGHLTQLLGLLVKIIFPKSIRVLDQGYLDGPAGCETASKTKVLVTYCEFLQISAARLKPMTISKTETDFCPPLKIGYLIIARARAPVVRSS